MRVPAYARARLVVGAVFLGAYVLQLSMLLLMLALRGIYLEDLVQGVKALTTLYAPQLGIVAATIFARPMKHSAGRAPAGAFWTAFVVCALWNGVLLCLSFMFALGDDHIEVFLPTTTAIGAETAWLTTGALAFFFAKDPE